MESEMARTHRVSMTGAVIVCLVSTQGNGTLFARDDEYSLREAPSSQSLTNRTSETQMSTSGELAPAISSNERPVDTDLSPASLPRMERSRFTLNTGGVTAN